MPRDGTIKRKLTVMVVAGALTPLVVAAFAVGALVIAGGQAVGIAAVVVIAAALSIAVYVAGTQRVRVLHDRFEKATKLANEVATVRLPEALEAARDGRTVDNGHAAFVPDEHDELSEIIAAFDRTQRTAITLAAEQARVRRQASEMFVDLGRRHQALLSRTLTLVTELEASERDPATVTELLRLDHLVTRMRRNAESLLVLAGSEPGRGRPTDTSIADVVRNALQEIEAYDRVDAQQLERGRVAGRVVAAVSHLLAELLENATMFSPPDSRVSVTGQHRPDGYVLSIVDHGIGLEPDELDAANSRLAQFRSEFTPPRRLGLAVVAELARRHGIVVQLQPTPSGGTTASVLLSPVLLAGAHDGIAAARAAAPVPAAPERPIPAPLPESLWAPGPPPPTRVAEPAGAAAAAPVDVIDLTRVEPVAVAGGGDGSALPRRVPGEQIPDLGPQRDDTDAPRRDGIDVAAQLNGFQEGVERARALGDADGTPTPLDLDDIDDVVDVTGERDTDVDPVAPSTGEAADPTPFTAAGLERRVAGEHLPDTGPARDPSATSPNREPDDVRNALTSFQYGVARGTLERVEPLNGEERP
jgi:signal transduction histidine kinase